MQNPNENERERMETREERSLGHVNKWSSQQLRIATSKYSRTMMERIVQATDDCSFISQSPKSLGLHPRRLSELTAMSDRA